MSIRTLFIDFDNTIHDSDPKFFKKLHGIMGLSGQAFWDLYMNKIHRGIVHVKYMDRHDDIEFHSRLLFEYLNQPYDRDTAKLIENRFNEALAESWENPTYYPEAIKFLDQAKTLGFKLCLTTGEYAKQKAMGLEKHSKKKYFDYVFGEADLGHRKNDPRYYGEALKRTDSAPQETCCIGDTYDTDILPAKQIGMKAIWVNRRGETSATFSAKADLETRDLKSALEYLKKTRS